MRRHTSTAVTIAATVLALFTHPTFASGQNALPAAVRKQAPDLRELGKGSQRLWGIRVYDASLWVVSNTWNPDEPHALQVEVQRAIPADVLVKAGGSEFDRLQVGDASKRTVWKSELAKVMPSIKKGERFVAFTAPNHATFFYLNGRDVGEINDPTFGPAFFSIWLDPRTANPALRKSLLNH